MPQTKLDREGLVLEVEGNRISLKNLEGTTLHGNTLKLVYPDGTKELDAGEQAERLHTQLVDFLKQKDTEAVLLEEAGSGRPESVEAVRDFYRETGETEKEARWQALLDLKGEAKKSETEFRKAGADWQNDVKLVPWHEMSADDLYLLSREYAEVNDRENEVKYLRHAADKSHPKAHYQLATYLATGMNGLQANETAAFSHMQEAANLGDPEAPYYLGVWYRKGFGTRKDLSKAKEWLEQDTTVKGLVQTALLLGDDLQDYEAAGEAAKEALDLTEIKKTREVLERKLESWKQKEKERDLLRQKHFRMAEILYDAGAYDLSLEQYQAAADLGNLEARYKLAKQYLMGQGTRADKKLAMLLFEQAKDREPESLYYLTFLEPDKKKAEQYAKAYLEKPVSKTRKEEVQKFLNPQAKTIREWLEEGNAMEAEAMLKEKAPNDAKAILAHLKQEAYEKGSQGEDETFVEAVLIVAAENGDGEAAAILGQAFLEEDPGRAIPWLQQACDADNADACALLAMIYMEGKGTEPDMEKGRELLKKALSLHSPLAEKWITRR